MQRSSTYGKRPLQQTTSLFVLIGQSIVLWIGVLPHHNQKRVMGGETPCSSIRHLMVGLDSGQ